MKTPSFWYKPPGFRSTLLAPLSLIYAAGRWLSVTFGAPHIFSQPVICVGNAVAGGAGKTPATLALTTLLQESGLEPHIVTRGYGGTETGPRRVAADDTARQVGDETMLLAQAAPTWVARNRALGIGCALSAGAPVVVLDDGLQNTKFRARLNILVVDGATGFGNGQLLPAGPLREFPLSLRQRVRVIVMIGRDVHNVASQFPDCPVFTAEIESDLSRLDPTISYVAFAGLARPEKFFDTCERAGLKIVDRRSFADHQPYDPAARAGLAAWAQQYKARLLTTEKDMQRWPVAERDILAVLPIKLRFDDPQAVRAFIRNMLDV